MSEEILTSNSEMSNDVLPSTPEPEEILTSDNEIDSDILPSAPEPVETEEERLAREEAERLAAEATKAAEEAARLAVEEEARKAAEAEHIALVESQKPEALRLLMKSRAEEATVEDAAAFELLDPEACSWAESELDERERLARAESQKEQAFRCWHHLMTSPKPRDEVRQHLLLLEPEAVFFGKEKIETELAALAKEKAAAETAGFSVPVTPAEAAAHETTKRRGGRR